MRSVEVAGKRWTTDIAPEVCLSPPHTACPLPPSSFFICTSGFALHGHITEVLSLGWQPTTRIPTYSWYSRSPAGAGPYGLVCNSPGVLGPPSQALQPRSNTGPEAVRLLRFRLFPFRLMLLGESLLIFFPRGHLYYPRLPLPASIAPGAPRRSRSRLPHSDTRR